MDPATIASVAKDLGLPIALAVWLLWRDRETAKAAALREIDLVRRLREVEERTVDLTERMMDALSKFSNAINRLSETVDRRPCQADPRDETKAHTHER